MESSFTAWRIRSFARVQIESAFIGCMLCVHARLTALARSRLLVYKQLLPACAGTRLSFKLFSSAGTNDAPAAFATPSVYIGKNLAPDGIWRIITHATSSFCKYYLEYDIILIIFHQFNLQAIKIMLQSMTIENRMDICQKMGCLEYACTQSNVHLLLWIWSELTVFKTLQFADRFFSSLYSFNYGSRSRACLWMHA